MRLKAPQGSCMSYKIIRQKMCVAQGNEYKQNKIQNKQKN